MRNPKRINRLIKRMLIALLLLGILAFFGMHFMAPYVILHPGRVQESLTPDQLGLDAEALELTMDDGVRLRGYWIEPEDGDVKGIVILVHGVGGCKEHYLGLSHKLCEEKIATVLFDGRAHGYSEGDYCTYGSKEKYDLQKVVDYIKSEEPDLPLGIWGNSLGGAVAIQTMALEKRIEFGVIESTFTSLRQIVRDYQKRIFKGAGVTFVADYSLNRAAKVAGFDPEKIKPLEAIEQVDQPLIIAHGDADRKISSAYGEALFKAAAAQDKTFVLVPGGKHSGLSEAGGEAYEEKLFSFIHRQIDGLLTR